MGGKKRSKWKIAKTLVVLQFLSNRAFYLLAKLPYVNLLFSPLSWLY